jgi:hypothetical protein
MGTHTWLRAPRARCGVGRPGEDSCTCHCVNGEDNSAIVVLLARYFGDGGDAEEYFGDIGGADDTSTAASVVPAKAFSLASAPHVPQPPHQRLAGCRFQYPQ